MKKLKLQNTGKIFFHFNKNSLHKENVQKARKVKEISPLDDKHFLSVFFFPSLTVAFYFI